MAPSPDQGSRRWDTILCVVRKAPAYFSPGMIRASNHCLFPAALSCPCGYQREPVKAIIANVDTNYALLPSRYSK